MKIVKRIIQEIATIFGYEIRKIKPGKIYDWLANENIKTILDIGANRGQFTARIHSLLPNAQIYAFEPLKSCFEELKRTMNAVPKFTCFNFALGNENGAQIIYRNNFAPSSSMLPMEKLHIDAFPTTKEVSKESVETYRLDDIAAPLDLIDNILIKIDVQGFEDRVIFGGYTTIRRAKVLMIETSFEPLYQGQLLFDSIYSQLTSTGFVLRGIEEPLYHPKDGRMLQCDCVFYRGD